MAKLFDIMGNFPFSPDEKKPTLIRRQDYSTALYPPNNAFTSDNTFTIVTTDTFMLGIYELGPGGVFAPLDIHPGDESYYILQGPVVQRSGNGQFAYLETGKVCSCRKEHGIAAIISQIKKHASCISSHRRHGANRFRRQSFRQMRKQNFIKDQTMINCRTCAIRSKIFPVRAALMISDIGR